MEIFFKTLGFGLYVWTDENGRFRIENDTILSLHADVLRGSSRVPEPLRTSVWEAILFYAIVSAFACGRVIRYVWTGPKY